MKNAVLWSQLDCAYCKRAKQLLLQNGYAYVEKIIGDGGSYTKKDLLEEVPNARTVPQIFINGRYIGGYKELEEEFKKV